MEGRGKLGGMWLPEGTLDDGIDWITTNAEQTRETSPQRDKQGRDGTTTPPKAGRAIRQMFRK